MQLVFYYHQRQDLEYINIQRYLCNDKATWTILPQVFYKCSKLNILFSRNLVLPSKLNIPRLYTDVYNLYIENFKKNH